MSANYRFLRLSVASHGSHPRSTTCGEVCHDRIGNLTLTRGCVCILKSLFPGPVLVGDEHVLFRKLLEQGRGFAEIRAHHLARAPRNPLREVDRLIDAVVEPDEDAALVVADVLDR